MGIFSRFSSPKVDEQKLSDLVFSMKTWFAPLDRNFKLDEKILQKFARNLILFHSNYDFSVREWDSCINFLEFFINHFKAGVFMKKLIPVEMIFSYEIRVFLKNKKFTKLNHFEYYNYDLKILRLMFSGRNLEHISRDDKLDVFNGRGMVSKKIFNLADVKKIMLHYDCLKKIFSKHFEFCDVGREIIKSFVESSGSFAGVANVDNISKNFMYCGKFDFDITFPDVYVDCVIGGVDVYPEGDFCVSLTYKNKLSYIICFDIVDLDEILIKQVQGISGASLRGGEYPLILINLVESFAKFIGFGLVSIVGVNSRYLRPYSGEHYYDYSKQVIVEKKYDVWANQLGYKFNLSERVWYKRV
jgi:hypothetical protein